MSNMGLGSSTEFVISPYLEALSSAITVSDSIFTKETPISLADSQSDFWDKLLDYNYCLADLQTYQIEEAILQVCEKLAANNPTTGNLLLLIEQLIELLNNFSCTAHPNKLQLDSLKILNAIFLVRTFIKYMIERKSVEELQQQFSSKNDSTPSHTYITICEQLVISLVKFLTECEINSITYDIHCEILNTLIILFSTQLFTPLEVQQGNLHCNIFFDIMFLEANHDGNTDNNNNFRTVSLHTQEKAAKLVSRLLQFFIEQKPRPLNEVLQPSKAYSILQRLTSAASVILFLPWNAISFLSGVEVATLSSDVQHPLADKSLLLLLLLVHRRDVINPFNEALCNFHDTNFDPLDQESGPAEDVMRVSLNELVNVMIQNLTDDRAILLLYFLIHGNNLFCSYLLSRTDLDAIMLPLLSVLYDAVNYKPQQIYMILISIFILSQDQAFNKSIHNLKVNTVPWYKEQLLSNISLGSLTVLVFVRIIQLNLSKLRDVYLHSNCFATLANMSMQTTDIHPHAAHKLVKLFELLSLKYKRIADKLNPAELEHEQLVGEQTPVISFSSQAEETSELSTYGDFLQMVLKIINSMIFHGLPHNPHLIYALLYQQNLFLQFQHSTKFGDLVSNIQKVTAYFHEGLEKAGLTEWSADIVLQTIKKCSLSWKNSSLMPFTELHFKYEEEENPEEFFTPYIWLLLTSYSGVKWNTSNIRLFQADLNDDSEDDTDEEMDDEELTVNVN